MNTQKWIFLSPHFDDVALSCGGLVWGLAKNGHSLEIWTIMGGFPPDENYSSFARENHQAWGMSGVEAIHMRRAEDEAACEVLRATPKHFNFLDAIYRRVPPSGKPVVKDNETLFSVPPEKALIKEIGKTLQKTLPENAQVVCPMGLGNHIDHQAVFLAGERSGRIECYYADYPYILEHFNDPEFVSGVWQKSSRYLSQDALQAWQEAVMCHRSQLSGFWRDDQEVRLSLRNYMAGGGGGLWRKRVS